MKLRLRLFDQYPGLRGLSIWVLGAEDAGVLALPERKEGLVIKRSITPNDRKQNHPCGDMTDMKTFISPVKTE